MLDTYGRRFFDPMINRAADMFIKGGFKPDQVTFAAFLTGLTSALMILPGWAIFSVALLWISGFLDAVDGAVARKTGKSSPWGTVLDITCDRVVEIALILCLAFKDHSTWPAMMVLLSGIIFSMTIFLTVGALSEKASEKSFYYQAGLAERTEGFLFFSMMILFPAIRTTLTLVFSLLIFLTGLQRLLEALRLFRQ